MNKQAAYQFAQWLKGTHPEIFLSILRHTQPGALGDISDTLSSIGDTLSSAVSAVGDFVSNPQNVASLSGAASAYFKSQTPVAANAQGAVFSTQLQRAQAGLAPAPIGYTSAYGSQPVYASGGQLYPVTATTLQGLQPSFLQKYGVILAIGGGAVLLLALLTR